MHNKLVHIKCYKIIIFLLFITLISLSKVNKSESMLNIYSYLSYVKAKKYLEKHVNNNFDYYI